MKNISRKEIYSFTQNISSDMREAVSHARWMERNSFGARIIRQRSRYSESKIREISFCPIPVLRGDARDERAASGV